MFFTLLLLILSQGVKNVSWERKKDHVSTQSLHSAVLVSQLPTPRKSEVFYRRVALPAPQIYKAGRTFMDHGIQQCSCFSHPASIEGRDASPPMFLERLLQNTEKPFS